MPTDVKETKAEPKKLKITLIKSTIGAVPKNRKIVESMGFKRSVRSATWSRWKNWTKGGTKWNYQI